MQDSGKKWPRTSQTWIDLPHRLVGGPDVELETFLRSEYPKHCDARDFTLTVIDRPVRRAWLDKRLERDPPR